MTKVIIAGGRNYRLSKIGWLWLEKYHEFYKIDQILCGKANGIDLEGERFGLMNQIPVDPNPAEWQNFDIPMVKVAYKGNYKYNALAGHYRNELMAQKATHLLLFPGGTGSNDMFKRATKHKLEITDFRSYLDLVQKIVI